MMLLKEELIQEKGKKEVYKGHQKKKKKRKKPEGENKG